MTRNLRDPITIDSTDVALIHNSRTFRPDEKWHPVLTDESHQSIVMDRETDRRGQQKFYEEVLHIPWLAPKVRNAVLIELGKSVRAERARKEREQTAKARVFLQTMKREMRQSREHPEGGIHDAAVAKTASIFGWTVGALEKRLVRHK